MSNTRRTTWAVVLVLGCARVALASHVGASSSTLWWPEGPKAESDDGKPLATGLAGAWKGLQERAADTYDRIEVIHQLVHICSLRVSVR